jgi:LacI family transcriptional regulator
VTTIRDVAKRAGVSVSTVSRVILDQPEVRSSTREQVLEAIEALDFRPSAIARSMIARRTKTIGVVISDISNPFYPELIKGVEDVSNEAGYTVILVSSADSVERHARVVETLRERRVDAYILASARLDDEVSPRILASEPAAVVVNRGLPDGAFSQVLLDNALGSQLAVQHLLALGHSRIAHVGGPAYAQNARERADGYGTAMRAAGLRPAAVLETSFFPAEGWEESRVKIRELLLSPQRPTAIFTANDLLAVQVLEVAVFELGLAVPRDLSIVGFDDNVLAGSPFVNLTTVSHRPREMGRLAVELALARLEGEVDEWPVRRIIEPQLVLRSSTTAPPSRLRRGRVPPSTPAGPSQSSRRST